MHPVFILGGLLIATLVAAFLPQIYWPDWPSGWVMALGMLPAVVWVLIDGLRSGEFDSNWGLFRRDERPIGFYFSAGLLTVAVCAIAGMLIVQAVLWFAAE